MVNDHAQTDEKVNWTLLGAKNPHIMQFSAKSCKGRGQATEKQRLTHIPQIQATVPTVEL